MSIPSVRKFVSSLGLWILITGVLLLIPRDAGVEAHGNHPKSELVLEALIDPYWVQVFAIPWVGDAHFSAYVVTSDVQKPVAAAEVSFALFGANGERVEFAANPVYGSPGWYTATVEIEQAGNVSAAVTVSGNIGQIDETFGMNIKAPESGTSWGMVGLIMVAVVLILRVCLNRIFMYRDPRCQNCSESPTS